MLNIDELHELAANRRSIRGYDKTKDVPDEMVRRFSIAPGGLHREVMASPGNSSLSGTRKDAKSDRRAFSSNSKNTKVRWRWQCAGTPR